MAVRVNSNVHSRRLVDDTDCKVKKSELNLGIRNVKRNTKRREKNQERCLWEGTLFHLKLYGIL